MILTALIAFITYILDAFAVLILVWAAVVAGYAYLRTSFLEDFAGEEIHAHERIRVELGQRLVLAVEFLVIGDVLATILNPSRQELLNLGIIVLVRTVLSFFVSREITDSLAKTTRKKGQKIKPRKK